MPTLTASSKDTSADHLPLLMTMSANSGPNSEGATALSAVLLGSLVLAPEMQVSGIRGWGRGLEDSKQEDSEVQNCTRGCRDSGLDLTKRSRMKIRRFGTNKKIRGFGLEQNSDSNPEDLAIRN